MIWENTLFSKNIFSIKKLSNVFGNENQNFYLFLRIKIIIDTSAIWHAFKIYF